ncbi:uridylate kinase [candidate division MSBL1 archaeon SCGC-AAA382A13]|uniref:Uridylate kinase n=1 Tax=candidate division MSBL1 archaeon SCGC-AAA382A13 TaxID=1698279 RepID=A0A133VD92_9EURY|nr:uridylate kinase [candidate division MSBL1 archaeon SCGC-AAA382A13]PTD94425.1 UMP kinase [archaeon SCG-AAA382B04]
MTTVINLGGSVLAPSLEKENFEEYANSLREIAKQEQLFIVTGGGVKAREYIGVARELGVNEAVCDKIGIDVTRLNARLLISALKSEAYPDPPKSYKEAENAMALDKIIVMGGVIPGQSTDAVAAILAEYVQADQIIFATSVNGVYDKDPNLNGDAKKIDKLSPTKLVKIVMETEIKAGSKAVVDPLAAKVIERSKIPTVVMNGKDPEAIKKAVLENKHQGTIIED